MDAIHTSYSTVHVKTKLDISCFARAVGRNETSGTIFVPIAVKVRQLLFMMQAFVLNYKY